MYPLKIFKDGKALIKKKKAFDNLSSFWKIHANTYIKGLNYFLLIKYTGKAENDIITYLVIHCRFILFKFTKKKMIDSFFKII